MSFETWSLRFYLFCRAQSMQSNEFYIYLLFSLICVYVINNKFIVMLQTNKRINRLASTLLTIRIIVSIDWHCNISIISFVDMSIVYCHFKFRSYNNSECITYYLSNWNFVEFSNSFFFHIPQWLLCNSRLYLSQNICNVLVVDWFIAHADAK